MKGDFDMKKVYIAPTQKVASATLDILMKELIIDSFSHKGKIGGDRTIGWDPTQPSTDENDSKGHGWDVFGE